VVGAQVARVVLAQHSVSADVRVEHWDVLGEAWRDAAAGPPGDAAPDPRAVHEHRQEQERQRSMATGIPAWQVRIEVPSHRDVTTLAKRLTSEGWPVARRRKYLVAGANCEDDANRLAQEIQDSSGTDALVSVQATLGLWSFSAVFSPMP
jgi:hypothetical protein